MGRGGVKWAGAEKSFWLAVESGHGMKQLCHSHTYSTKSPPNPAGEIVKEMGWVALFTRGLPLRIIMIGTLTGLQWGIYDAFKVFVGL